MSDVSPVIAKTLRAATALLDAYGGDTPSWIRDEAVALAEAIEMAQKRIQAGSLKEGSDQAFGTVRRAAKEMLDAYGGAAPDWLRNEAVALETALRSADATFGSLPPPSNVVAVALGAARVVMESYLEDFRSGIEEGLYDDKEGLKKAEAAAQTLDRMAPALAKAYVAAAALLTAYGDDIPDSMREEFAALESAVNAVEAASAPEPALAGPRP
jgi:hypothetical protein